MGLSAPLSSSYLQVCHLQQLLLNQNTLSYLSPQPLLEVPCLEHSSMTLIFLSDRQEISFNDELGRNDRKESRVSYGEQRHLQNYISTSETLAKIFWDNLSSFISQRFFREQMLQNLLLVKKCSAPYSTLNLVYDAQTVYCSLSDPVLLVLEDTV
ncbi:MAG: hypothetical protein EZS28_018211 [Streblomastix strix]|uniref:Uncharacterized protein n=1 Tax=Streblomastix strix TaxID=222440 RepID=A0A5J4VUA8_9EUKA|nr:MAG: hypothetical protein EZS28_018211 [Streblomastix strix]